MKIERPSQLLGLFTWASFFVLAWMMLLRNVPSDAMSWGFLAAFFVIGVFVAAVTSPAKVG